MKKTKIEYDRETHRLSLHSLRHPAASRLVRAGVDPKSLADHLGDSVQVVLATYVHAVADERNLGEVLAA